MTDLRNVGSLGRTSLAGAAPGEARCPVLLTLACTVIVGLPLYSIAQDCGWTGATVPNHPHCYLPGVTPPLPAPTIEMADSCPGMQIEVVPKTSGVTIPRILGICRHECASPNAHRTKTWNALTTFTAQWVNNVPDWDTYEGFQYYWDSSCQVQSQYDRWGQQVGPSSPVALGTGNPQIVEEPDWCQRGVQAIRLRFVDTWSHEDAVDEPVEIDVYVDVVPKCWPDELCVNENGCGAAFDAAHGAYGVNRRICSTTDTLCWGGAPYSCFVSEHVVKVSDTCNVNDTYTNTGSTSIHGTNPPGSCSGPRCDCFGDEQLVRVVGLSCGCLPREVVLKQDFRFGCMANRDLHTLYTTVTYTALTYHENDANQYRIIVSSDNACFPTTSVLTLQGFDCN